MTLYKCSPSKCDERFPTGNNHTAEEPSYSAIVYDDLQYICDLHPDDKKDVRITNLDNLNAVILKSSGMILK